MREVYNHIMSYPAALQYYIKRVENVSRQKLKLYAQSQTTFGPGDSLQIVMPIGLCCLDTFAVQGKLVTTVGGGTTPSVLAPPVEMLIDSVSVAIGGVQIQSSFSQYNQLFGIWRDYQLGLKKAIRGVAQNDSNPSTMPTSTTVNTPFAITQWLGFIGSVLMLDTSIVPQVTFTIRLAPIAVLSASGSPTSIGYQLQNVYATVDVLSVDDGQYYAMVQSMLSKSPISIPYDNWLTVLGNSGTLTGSTRATSASDCVSQIYGTILDPNYTNSVHVASTCLSTYFSRGVANVTTSQFLINNSPIPVWACDLTTADAWVQTLQTLGIDHDVYVQPNANINTLALYNTPYFVHAINLGINTPQSDHYLIGASARAGSLNISWQLTGSGTGIPVLFIRQKSLLRIGAGLQAEMVL
jgi:hypothetical protein